MEPLGIISEDIIEKYARNMGFKILGRNIAYPVGEIDIVARDKDTIVCIEVKAQMGESENFSPELHFTNAKYKKVASVFSMFLAENNLLEKEHRIDLAAVYIKDLEKRTASVKYYKNVFEGIDI